jgi:hypothetical protein
MRPPWSSDLCGEILPFWRGSERVGGPSPPPVTTSANARSYWSVENRKIVVEWNTSPGLSTVEGKVGWFGESGKCCVSNV